MVPLSLPYRRKWILATSALLLGLPGAVTGAEPPAHQLDFHGYFRTGVGVSEGGTTQADFQAPGAPTRYRLGNEAHTNVELALDYRYHHPDAPEGRYFQGYFMVDDFEPFGESDELGFDHTAQAYVKLAGHVAPGVDLWFGRRYYDRKAIGINRHYWLNPGQNGELGGGIEGVRLGPGALQAALFRNEDKGVRIGTARGTVHSTVLDLRWSDLPGVAGGRTTGWGSYAQRAEQQALGLASKGGFGLGLWHDIPGTWGGRNTTALLYRTGAAIPQGPYNPNPVREDQGYDLDRAASWEINNSLLMEPGGDFALLWALIARITDFGKAGRDGAMLRWYSTGVRPVWYLSPRVSLAFEAGTDYVDDEVKDRAGHVTKLTAALQFTRARVYDSKPVVRLFVTRAAWSDDFRGLVGNTPDDAPYGDDTAGWNFGTQVEMVW